MAKAAHRSRYLVCAQESAIAGALSITMQAIDIRGAAPTHNLPIPRTSFISRDQEIGDLRQRLEATRLLTIVGVGGAGKSRLALELAWGFVGQYSDGVWLVELAPLLDSALVPHHVASVLGLLELPGQAANRMLAEALRTRRLLLVLDNCEHLLTGCADLTESLLQTCPYLQILATSRAMLGLVGETVWRVPSLSLPDTGRRAGASEVAESEAGRLFLERAQAIAPDFVATDENAEAIANVCVHLDGIPLALELAAARVRSLGVAELVARLDDRFRLLVGGHPGRPVRQRTLRAAVEWSYDLLSTTEQEAFVRLSVFNGGWTLEAAEAVCGAAFECVVDVLEQLIDKSLVIAEPSSDGSMRYRVLETLREYGAERLESMNEAGEVHQRHAEYFCEVLPRWWQPKWWGPDLITRARHVEEELANLRAALRWLVSACRLEPALRLGYALGPFWLMTARVSEGRAQLGALVAALPRDAEPSATRAGVLAWLGGLTIQDGDYSNGRAILEESLSVARTCGDDLALAYALTWLATCCEFWGHEPDLARTYAVEGVSICRAGRYRAVEAMGLRVLAQIALEAGNLNETQQLAEESLAAGREAEHPQSIAWALHALGLVQFLQGKLPPARSLFLDSLSQGRGMVAAPIRLTTLAALAWVYIEEGEFARASALCLEALDMVRRVLVGGAFLSVALEAVGRFAAATNQPERALRLAGAAASVDGAALRTPIQLDQLARWVSRARAALGEAAAKAAWVGGQALNDEDAVAEAVSLLASANSYESGPGEAPQDGTELTGRVAPAGRLTPRELEVAGLIARGFSNRQIAQTLVVAVPTAERHVANTLRKLGFGSRAQIAVWASRHAGPLLRRDM